MTEAVEELKKIEVIELPLLLEAIFQRYGYDFRDYAPASLGRRLRRAMAGEGVATFSAFQDRLLHQPAVMARFLDIVSVNVTAMYRDPGFYRVLREKVVPGLRALPLIRAWHAGCATGEEVYSLAVLLHEEGLLERTRLYATDANPRVIERAREGIFPLQRMRDYTANYQRAGGTGDFSAYYTAKHEGAILRDFLRRNIVWAEHNLVSDSSFNEFHLIFCRNVLIYFSRPLQERVHRLLYQSLAMGGVLALGHSESLSYSAPPECRYETIDGAEKIYQRVNPE